MSYRLSGLLAKDAEPYHVDRVAGSATVDTTRILLDELARVTDSNGLLPQSIASHGSSRIADDVNRVLEERGQQHYTAAQWRSALREVFRRLTDNSGDLSKRSPNIARKVPMDLNSPTGRDDLARRADQILEARGEYDPDAETYSAALDEAAAEFTADVAEPVAYPGDPGGEALHLAALKILADRQNWDYDGEDYTKALNEAARVLSIDLSGRNRR